MSFDWESHREQLVADRIKFLMSEGQEYYPFELNNFTEALQNIDDTQVWRLNLQTRTAAVSIGERPAIVSLLNEVAGECLVSVVTEYWRAIATNSAERQIKSAEEMEFDQKKFGGNIP